jgi:hypothetical protein
MRLISPYYEVDLAVARAVVLLDQHVTLLFKIPQRDPLSPVADPALIQLPTPA